MEYDPLISKLAVWGSDRQQVLTRMLRALEEYRILGIRTNISYLRDIVSHPRFIAGDYDTRFIPNHQHELLKPAAGGDDSIALSAAAVLNLIQSRKHPAGCDQARGKTSYWKIRDRIWKFPR
jgi:acetyl/propionyl-CoA carboxylase alpha subunit